MHPLKAGDVCQLSPLVRRITAPNPGPLTGRGTNTYIVGQSTVIDPGPENDAHIQAILKATQHHVDRILVTHTHDDHSPAAARLAKLTGARLYGSHAVDDGYQDKTFCADVVIHPGDVIELPECSVQAIHTPGHVGNHMCFLLTQEGILFSGDHIMEGSTVVIIPPGGDMADYISSLRLLKELAIQSIAPGHGELIQRPMEWIDYLIQHRLMREQKVIKAISAVGSGSIKDITRAVYDDVDSSMHEIAQISLWAHMLKLEKDGQVSKCSDDSVFFADQHWHWLGQVLE